MIINTTLHLHSEILTPEQLPSEATRQGYGRGLLEVAEQDERVVGLCADLTESTQMHHFAQAYPDRFIQVGVAEQNLVTVASGLAAVGKIPFAASFAAFSPGRNWEQIRTTICYNNQPVKIVGSHAGLAAGPDGATHQMLEDIALMRVLPNMVVVVPADSEQAAKATRALACDARPAYLRVIREKTPVWTTSATPFEIGKAQLLCEGTDLTIIATGAMVYEALRAAYILREQYSVEVINMHTISPIDIDAIVRSASKTRRVITVEDHQIVGGLGGAVAEVLAEHVPTPLVRLGVRNRFGESGSAAELWSAHGLLAPDIMRSAQEIMKRI